MRDWSDVVPMEVAIRQRAWQRRCDLARLKQATKLTYAQMGQRLGLSSARVMQLVWKHKFEPVSPVERYLNDRTYLHDMARFRRKRPSVIAR